MILKSKSGNPDDTILNGEVRVSDIDRPIGAEINGLTIQGSSTGFGIISIGFASGTAKNCKIMYCSSGMAAATDASVSAENCQFISCETGMSGGHLTGVSATNCQFIDCGEAMLPGGGPDDYYYSKNNVEIHTDVSGKQVVTPIPDYPEKPATPPANNTTKPTNTTVPTTNTTTNPAPAETPVDDAGSSSGGSSHSSSGGSGGASGGSPEPARNVAHKDTTKVFVPNGKTVTLNFTNNATVVKCITFESEKTVGKITAIAEDLKNKSTLVKDLPEGKVYKSFNIWVGNAGYGDSNSILNATITFKVEKSWLEEKNLDPSFIILYKYNDKNKTWVEISTKITDEDDQFVYFTAKVLGYSSFVIAAKDSPQLTEEPTEKPVSSEVRSAGNGTVTKRNQKSTGFGIIAGIICLLCMFLYKIKEK